MSQSLCRGVPTRLVATRADTRGRRSDAGRSRAAIPGAARPWSGLVWSGLASTARSLARWSLHEKWLGRGPGFGSEAGSEPRSTWTCSEQEPGPSQARATLKTTGLVPVPLTVISGGGPAPTRPCPGNARTKLRPMDTPPPPATTTRWMAGNSTSMYFVCLRSKPKFTLRVFSVTCPKT